MAHFFQLPRKIIPKTTNYLPTQGKITG